MGRQSAKSLSQRRMESKNSKSSTFRSKFSKRKLKRTKSETKLPPVSYFSLFRYSSALDKFMISCGLIAAFIQGAAMPFNILVFGRMTDAFVGFAACDEASDNISSAVVGNESLSNSNCSAVNPEDMLNRSQDLGAAMATFAIYYVCIACVVIVSGFVEIYTLAHSATRQTRRIRQLFFRAVIRQEMEWIESREAGELNTRLNDDVIKIGDAIGEKLALFTNNIAAAIVGILIGFINGWKLTLIVLATAPVLGGGAACMGKFLSTWGEKETRAYSKAAAMVDNALRNIRTVVAYGAQNKEVERYNENLGEAEKQGVRKGMILGAFQGLVWCTMLLAYALAFWYGSTLALTPEENFSVGRLMTVFFAIMLAAFNLGMASSALDTFLTGKGVAAAIFHIIERKSSIDPMSDDGVVLNEVKGDICFNNVGFCYPTRTHHQVLKNFNAEFVGGQIFALTGASGTGKSTVLKLIQRLYNPFAGKITLDGEDVKTFNVRWLRSLIGVVQQEPILFATSISDNIKLGSESASEEDIINATKAANAYDFIMELPEKFDTLVGVGGCQLSGGQKQRIAIARALVRNPKILLLDQACSALDTHSQAVVLENLSKARINRTTIMVAHRQSSLHAADHVMNLNYGDAERSGESESETPNNKLWFVNETFMPEEVEADENSNGGKANINSAEDIKLSLPDDPTTCSPDLAAVEPDVVEELDQHSSVHSDEDDVEKAKEEEEPEPGTSMRILRMNLSEYPYILLASLGALLAGAVQPIFAVMLASVIGVYVTPGEGENKQDRVNFFCIIMTAIALVTFFAHFFQHYMFAKSGEILTRRIRRLTYSAILRQDMAYFDSHATGSSLLSSRLANDASRIQGAAGIRVGYSLSIIASVALALAIALYSGWKLALLQIAFLPLIAGSQAVQSRMLHANALRDQKTLEVAGELVKETMNTYDTVVLLGKEEYFALKYQQIIQTISKNGRKAALVQGLIFGFATSVVYFSYAATFRYGAELIGNREIGVENMFRVYFVIIFAGISLGRSNRHMPDFGKAKKAASRTFEILDRKPAIDVQSDDGITPSAFRGDLQLTSCEFTYSTRQSCKVIENLNIGIESGKTLALVGKSGCGKSTIVQLIERFYDPDLGTVLIDGEDVRSYNLKFLRSKIGVVFQDPALFDGSIYENIVYGDVGNVPTMEEVHAATRKANIHDFITGLEQGYDTPVGNIGSRFSRGQRQRIAIARALVRNPSILLLDEATSSLDSANEKIVQEALDRAREGRTSVMIAHRLSTIQNADKIAVMSRGKILETGTHESLMESQGSYFDLVNAGITLS